ncbi:MAG: phosphoribosylaminoimidazolesuccinocarboxamide synthase [Chitinophagales bacterium]|nr:phosphoribosylaminoimidazolesuccinocarboxamide synthase [Chitinophagales bacterium]
MQETKALKETNFNFPGQTAFYRGKVRDVYSFQDELIMIASDRISAFDHILPRPIPYKGQVLNQIARKFLTLTNDIVPNWLTNSPHPNVSIGVKAQPFKVEMVIRGYLAGHSWRVYSSGERVLSGVTLPAGLKENDKLPSPVITPATKAESGHDEDISREEIIKQGIVSEQDYEMLETYTHNLYKRGSEIADSKGLILVDTKYEFGKLGDKIYLIDEVHTPDSSRYFYKENYAQLQSEGKPQKHLSKEFVRQWLIENGFQGLEGQSMPELPDEFVLSASDRYIELYEKLTGEAFVKAEQETLKSDIENAVLSYLQKK